MWHGPSLADLLEGIHAEQAAARPIRGAHTIWELVLHITGWKGEVRRRLSGAPAGDPEEGDWPAVGAPTAERWEDARARVQKAHDALLAAVRQIPESRLYEATNDRRNPPLGTGVSYYILLHGIVQHDVYHSGQIALLKKAVTL